MSDFEVPQALIDVVSEVRARAGRQPTPDDFTAAGAWRPMVIAVLASVEARRGAAIPADELAQIAKVLELAGAEIAKIAREPRAAITMEKASEIQRSIRRNLRGRRVA